MWGHRNTVSWMSNSSLGKLKSGSSHRRSACNVTRMRGSPRVCGPNSYHIVFKAGHGVRKYSQTHIACPIEFQISLTPIIFCFLRFPFCNGLSILLLFCLLKTHTILSLYTLPMLPPNEHFEKSKRS